VSLIYLSCAWVAGIFLGSVFGLPLPFLLIGLLPLPLLLVRPLRRKATVLAILCLLVLCGGTLRFQSSLPVLDEDHLQFYTDTGTVEMRGTVSDDPETGDKTAQLRFSVREIRIAGQWQAVSGTALLFVPPYPSYDYGDVLQVTGKLATPPQLDDFDYAAYLARQGIQATMLYPGIEVLDTGKGSPALAWIYSLRHTLSQSLAEILPEPQASLAQSLILGMRKGIPSSLKSDFAQSGTTHLLAISGLHLSIIAGMLLDIGARLFGRRRYGHIWLALAGVWLYAVITGMNPPVLRAAIMASLFLAAGMLGRQRSAITGLAFAAAIMTAANPRTLWDVSFQMSFLAMAGLISVSPFLQSWGREAVNRVFGEDGAATSAVRYVTDNLSITLGVLVTVWPLIAYYFGIISLIAPLATFLALPALPWVIVTGTLTAGLGLIIIPVAQVVGWLAWLCTSWMLLVVTGLAGIPGASIEAASVNAGPVLAYYVVFAAAICLRKYWPQASGAVQKGTSILGGLSRKRVLLPLAAVAVLAIIVAVDMPDDNLHVSFLDVGQGDAILIQTPYHQDILVDGGPSPRDVALALGKKMPFWDRTIDLVVLTHPHADHITGLLEVLRRYRVKQVLFPPLDDGSPLCDEWLSLIEEKGIKQTIAQAGQQIDLGTERVTIEVLNPLVPPLAGTVSDIDDNGVVMKICAGQVSFLLAADISWQTEYELLRRRANLNSVVLKAGHHGSDTSTSQEFLAVVDPCVAVICVGEDNRFGHPTEGVTRRLMEEVGADNIYRTDLNGTIEFITDGEGLWVRVER